MHNKFLPISKSDLNERGWDSVDIIIVTGDAYVDHHSYGASVIGRILESAGYRVGIIAQPDPSSKADFMKLGRPRLFFGVTAGNLDSMVANYTAGLKPRSSDAYSPGGLAGLRPDRATIIYSNRIRESFSRASIVIGGIEASMRRLAHYDYWSSKVRGSILLDSKADMLVYGMGENQVLEIARRLKAGEDLKSMDDIHGTAIARNSIAHLKDCIEISSLEEVTKDPDKFNRSFSAIYRENDPVNGKVVVQRHGTRYVISLPPARPLTTGELDRVYELDYAGAWHDVYDKRGGIPGFETVRNSIISHRGCAGQCNFCSLYLHQGRIIQSRSAGSIVREVSKLAGRDDFNGTITDIGGPTANMYRATCPSWARLGACRDKKCLFPRKCESLKLGYDQTLRLWEAVKKIRRVKHVFVSSGVRYDLLVDAYSDLYLDELCRGHISGYLKVAPEHSRAEVLTLMNKPPVALYGKFVERFIRTSRQHGKKQYLVNYFLSGHPGATLEDALDLAVYLAKRHINPEQVQDFIPLPMTISGAAYYTGKDPFTGKVIYVARKARERRLQRALLQSRQPGNRKYVLEALKKLKKLHLAKLLTRAY